MTARACGFLNIMRQTKGILDIKIIFMDKRNIYCVTGSLMSANIQRSSKVSDLIYCFSDFRDQSNWLAVCNILSSERDDLT